MGGGAVESLTGSARRLSGARSGRCRQQASVALRPWRGAARSSGSGDDDFLALLRQPDPCGAEPTVRSTEAARRASRCAGQAAATMSRLGRKGALQRRQRYHGCGIHSLASSRVVVIQPDVAFPSDSQWTCSHAERWFHVLLSTLLQIMNSPAGIVPISFASERIMGSSRHGLGLSSYSTRPFVVVASIPPIQGGFSACSSGGGVGWPTARLVPASNAISTPVAHVSLAMCRDIPFPRELRSVRGSMLV